MKPKACTVDSHDALKADAEAWGALPIKPDWPFRDRVLQVRDCPDCGSTLCKDISTPETETLHHAAAAAAA